MQTHILQTLSDVKANSNMAAKWTVAILALAVCLAAASWQQSSATEEESTVQEMEDSASNAMHGAEASVGSWATWTSDKFSKEFESSPSSDVKEASKESTDEASEPDKIETEKSNRGLLERRASEKTIKGKKTTFPHRTGVKSMSSPLSMESTDAMDTMKDKGCMGKETTDTSKKTNEGATNKVGGFKEQVMDAYTRTHKKVTKPKNGAPDNKASSPKEASQYDREKMMKKINEAMDKAARMIVGGYKSKRLDGGSEIIRMATNKESNNAGNKKSSMEDTMGGWKQAGFGSNYRNTKTKIRESLLDAAEGLN